MTPSALFRKSLLGITLTASIILAGCAASENPPALDPDKTYKLTVLHTNDNHGRFWQNEDGEWGMAARKTLIDSIREEVESEGGNVLLLSGGDINTGVPESDLQDAIPDFTGMNAIGYDAMAVGNHEFDNPLETLQMQEALADFPFLSANIYQDSTNDRLFDPYELFEFNGLTVAVLGLTTEDTAKVALAENIEGLEIRNPVDEANDLVPELKEKADIMIASTHMGHYQNANHGANAPGDVTLAREVDDIDLIVGGHSQNPLFKPDQQNDTWIIQAYEWGKYVGRADFEFKNGELKLTDYELIPVNHKDDPEKIAQDPELITLLEPFQLAGSKMISTNIGQVDERLKGERNEVRFGYTNLGTLMARAQQVKAQADFGVINSGGIRASIEAGDISYKDVLMVQPFGNSLTYVELTGKEVMDYLSVVATMPTNSGAFAQFSGIEMTVEGKAVRNIRIQGKPLNLKKTYRMSFNNFSAAGGDGYPNLSSHPNYVDTGYADADVLKEFIENNSPIRAADYEPGNIVRL